MIETVGILMSIIMVGAALLVLVRMRRAYGTKKKKDTPQTSLERAVWAWARVVSSSPGTAGLGGMVRVTLELEVHLPGTPVYTTTSTWLVEQEALEYIETGKDVSLKVDPLSTEHIYPNGSWAKLVEKK